MVLRVNYVYARDWKIFCSEFQEKRFLEFEICGPFFLINIRESLKEKRRYFVSNSVSLVPLPLVSQRYAKAFFDLVQEAGCVEHVEKEVASLLNILEQNEDLKYFVHSPFFSEKEQKEALNVLCETIEFAHEEAGRIFRNFLGVIAANRRLFALSSILRAFQRHIVLFRREFFAQVVSAYPLNADQKEMLRTALENVVKGKIVLQFSSDPTILGGFIIRLGSCQIDASLITKLSSLKLALKKEVS